MNLYDIRLELVRVEEIHGLPFDPSEDEEGYAAKMNVEFIGSIKELKVRDNFDVRINLETSIDGNEGFFSLSMIGTFQAMTDAAMGGLDHPDAPYELGSLLYPYVRNVAKPLLEYLGANAIEFPFAPPAPPLQAKPPLRKRRLKNTEK